MFLEIITPSKKVFSGEVTLAKVPGKSGSFEILENHAPIIATLEEGQVKVVDRNKKVTFYDVSSGVVEVKNNNIVVLIESA